MMKLMALTAAAVLAVGISTTAMATTIVHFDSSSQFTTFRGAGSAPVGRLTVSSAQTISSFGVNMDLGSDSAINFLIFNSTTGALLFQSGASLYQDTGGGYKFSGPLSFTFNPGTTYGLTAIANGSASYLVDFTANTVGAFSFLTGNQNVDNFGAPVLNLGQNCCDVDTALVLANSAAVPEPATWALMLAGFGLVGGAVRRRKPVLAAA